MMDPEDFPDAQSHVAGQPISGVGDSNLLTPIPGMKASQSSASALNLPQQPKDDSTAISPAAAAAPNLPAAHFLFDSQICNGGGDQTTETAQGVCAAPNLPAPQIAVGSQENPGGGVQTTETAQRRHDSQRLTGGFGSNVEERTETQRGRASHGRFGLGPFLADPALAMCADVVDDLERVKIANQNRLRTLTAQDEYGHGLTLDHPDIKRLANLVESLEQAEHQAVLNLSRVMRHHPLGPWVKAHNGVGEKQAARLLAAIRDPYWNDLHDRPRKLRELYRFCGMDVVPTAAHSPDAGHVDLGGGVAPTKARGERVTWSPDARMRLWLIADKCVQITSSPYRKVYDDGRAKYADAVHTEECRRCGPKGQPAQPGTPLSAGHQHARARRLIAKAILRDLWTEAQRLHHQGGAQ